MYSKVTLVLCSEHRKKTRYKFHTNRQDITSYARTVGCSKMLKQYFNHFNQQHSYGCVSSFNGFLSKLIRQAMVTDDQTVQNQKSNFSKINQYSNISSVHVKVMMIWHLQILLPGKTFQFFINTKTIWELD